MKAVLEVDGLDVGTADLRLVSDVSFTIGAGERVGLIGESGSGKSLTALAMLGLLPEGVHARGSVRLAGVGHDLVGAPEQRMAAVRGAAMTMVFQEPMSALNPTMRVGDQVAEVMLLHGTQADRRAARAAAVELLDSVHLPDPERLAHAYPHQLSGGQRQRVMIAIALANGPSVLLADEPTTALDVTVQAQVLDLILSGVAQRDAALLFITHDLAVVATVCERVMVMYGGRIVESGPVKEVFAQPRHPYTHGLLAASDLTDLDGDGRLRTIPGSVPAAGRFPDGCVFRTRCPNAADDCTVLPAWTESDGGGYACHHPVATPEKPPSLQQSHFRATPLQEGGFAASSRPALIEVRDLQRVHRRPRTSLRQPPPTVQALRGVSFDIAEGQRFGLVGESGSGKSTLIRLLAGLDSPTAGTISFDGRDVGGQPERRLGFLRERLQVVFQDPMGSLDPRMRVRDIVAEPLAGRREPDVRGRVAELLTAVGLPADAGDRYPHQFSGGQRQRISIARALASRPSVLVADEPVSALDVSVRAQILNLLAELVERFRLTLVFVSHDLSVVRQACDTIAVLHHGELVELGPSAQVADAPGHPYTRRLVAAVPTIRGALAGRTAADLARGAPEEL
ncbi:ABC transporter ATP-binding protein [Pseudonocardia adelaidensis]|uniref:ABC transporter ATP-binding protein n=1 Tax=Pseudonocardia adelaidensis TaxID=648754 RepID=A0ABP9NZ84_9PSEU